MKRCSWVNVDNALMLEYHDREMGRARLGGDLYMCTREKLKE